MRKKTGVQARGVDLCRIVEDVYLYYHKPRFIHPDPLEFLLQYPDIRDREIAAIVASSLAYGRIPQVLASVAKVLDRMGDSPRSYLDAAPRKQIFEDFRSFRHRFTTGEEMADFLWAIGRVACDYGSLEACFMEGYDERHTNTLTALENFADALARHMVPGRNSLLPMPRDRSACKRLHLFLRWMVRSDSVDPGGWHGVWKGHLVVPLDAHMYSLGKSLGMTRRSQADLKTALEITEALRKVDPEDPVRFDFSLTRWSMRKGFKEALTGIRSGMDIRHSPMGGSPYG